MARKDRGSALFAMRCDQVHPSRYRKWSRADAFWVLTGEEPDFSDPKGRVADPMCAVEPESRWWLSLYSPETLARLKERGLA